jgi:hypothetical protein
MKSNTGEQNNMDVGRNVKLADNCTLISRRLTVLLLIMYVRSFEICAVDQQMNTGKICLWYIVY